MRFVLPLALVGLGVTAMGQSPLTTPLASRPIQKKPALKFTQDHGSLFFNTNIGSFKLLGANEVPVEGTLDMTFKGTVLISNLDSNSTLMITGNVRKEIDDTKLNKQVYFGEGRITVVGKWRAVQFFGQNLRASFNGFGVLRMYGEFDRNLDTGYFWYPNEDPLPWNNGGMTAMVPRPDQVKPKVTIEGQK